MKSLIIVFLSFFSCFQIESKLHLVNASPSHSSKNEMKSKSHKYRSKKRGSLNRLRKNLFDNDSSEN
jgi:hypothetical protein